LPHERIFVVGHQGMLGQVVAKGLGELGHEVVTTGSRFGAQDDDPLIADVANAACSVVVNCAAGLPGRASGETMWLANALLPIRLASILAPGQMLIHASTDGVFSGASGPYLVTDLPDAEDTYGRTKRVGEAAASSPGVVVIRTSIIGTGAGILGWLLDQSGDVDGYVNHRWSGVTTLEWTRRCAAIIALGDRHSRIEHLASPGVTKYQMLVEAARAFDLPVRVRRATAATSVDRTLIPTIATGPIGQQLDELQRWGTG